MKTVEVEISEAPQELKVDVPLIVEAKAEEEVAEIVQVEAIKPEEVKLEEIKPEEVKTEKCPEPECDENLVCEYGKKMTFLPDRPECPYRCVCCKQPVCMKITCANGTTSVTHKNGCKGCDVCFKP